MLGRLFHGRRLQSARKMRHCSGPVHQDRRQAGAGYARLLASLIRRPHDPETAAVVAPAQGGHRILVKLEAGLGHIDVNRIRPPDSLRWLIHRRTKRGAGRPAAVTGFAQRCPGPHLE
jgi:hypothetical protein